MVDGHCSMLMLIIVITLLAQLVSRIAANCIYDLCGACPLNEKKIVPSGSGIAISVNANVERIQTEFTRVASLVCSAASVPMQHQELI